DSDGWYDHVSPPILNRSATSLDYLCGDVSDGPGARCGYGPRLPFVVVSPFAKQNYVSSTLIDQSSIRAAGWRAREAEARSGLPACRRRLCSCARPRRKRDGSTEVALLHDPCA